MVTEKQSSIKDLKKKLRSYLRQESTIYFHIEDRLRHNLATDAALESKAEYFDKEITKLQKQIRTMEESMA